MPGLFNAKLKVRRARDKWRTRSSNQGSTKSDNREMKHTKRYSSPRLGCYSIARLHQNLFGNRLYTSLRENMKSK